MTFVQANTESAPTASSVPVNPVSAIPASSEADFTVPGFFEDEEPVLAGPGETRPFYTADRLSHAELVAAFYVCDRTELPTVATCPLREFEAMAVNAVERVGIRAIRELSILTGCPKVAASCGRSERMIQAQALARAYLDIADLLDVGVFFGGGCDVDNVWAGLTAWMSAVVCGADLPLTEALAALPNRAAGTADLCTESDEAAPLVSRFGGRAFAMVLYLGGVELPSAGVLSLDDYEDLARVAVAGLGSDSITQLMDGITRWDIELGPADLPNAARFEAAAALSRDAADLVRAARYRKTVARFEARLSR
ncbi:hypothetical protein [Glycomyces paridis]|uniref:Uncharacterized protein n=1 Tax=Glycomyces paridis TaxID=2126555 RepID=A0A4S8PA09_9ACTN|nr:hypothetical protein [Glycomyces paridis]THV27113.1 hypothetical protein E9998_16755 [Glycomyces paridis]